MWEGWPGNCDQAGGELILSKVEISWWLIPSQHKRLTWVGWYIRWASGRKALNIEVTLVWAGETEGQLIYN